MKLALFLAAVPVLWAQSPEAVLRRALAAKTGSVTLPSGTIEITREILLAPDAHDLDIKGANTTIRAAGTFRGRALIALSGGRNIRIHDVVLDGNREAVGRLSVLPPSGTMLSRFVADNGIVAEGVTGLAIGPLKVSKIAGFAILVNAGHNVQIDRVDVTESGGLNPQRKNNGTGGIALEEGTTDFSIRNCLFGTIRGDGVTIRGSQQGRISENEFRAMARDAVHVSRGAGIAIADNHAEQIGIPVEEVDAAGALCMRLEQFQNGEVTGNTCSEALLGAMTISGLQNRIANNRFTGLNQAHRDAAGIFLASGASQITVEANEISGSGMSLHCVGAAPDVNKNDFKALRNDCSDEASVAGLRNYPFATRDTAFTTFRHGIFSQSSTTNISPSRHDE
ncbi:MAG: right-handed parallel beta-helix repeat-containing protein [Acidobacteriota bacterium]|nr:right-handed parallel beta-helix repeat-containing protein [Acidobacteriota bacterium]